MKVQKFKRGQIWWYETGTNYNGSIPGKTRPVIIMSNELANEHSSCLLGIPCTTAAKTDLPTHTSFYIDGTSSTALAENMLSVNKDRLTDYIGTVDDELLVRLENNIAIALGLQKMPMSPAITINPEAVVDIIPESESEDIKPKNITKMDQAEKQIFLADYKNHDIDYMLKKYNLKDKRALQQKIYVIRKEFGLGVRNK